MNALRVLMGQHDRMEALLADLRQAAGRGDEVRREALQGLAREVRRHFEIEERLFYPAIGPRLILVDAARFLEEHRQVGELVDRLEAAAGGAGSDPEKACELLHDALVAHVGDEEIELFPEVKRRFDIDELDALGEQIERAMAGEPAPTHVEEPVHTERP